MFGAHIDVEFSFAALGVLYRRHPKQSCGLRPTLESEHPNVALDCASDRHLEPSRLAAGGILEARFQSQRAIERTDRLPGLVGGEHANAGLRLFARQIDVRHRLEL